MLSDLTGRKKYTMNRHTKYFKVESKDCTHIKCELYYNLGGINYFTYKEEPRGYYVSVSPVTRSGNCESYMGFSGIKKCVLEVKRASKAAEAKAESLMEDAIKPLFDYIVEKTGAKVCAE